MHISNPKRLAIALFAVLGLFAESSAHALISLNYGNLSTLTNHAVEDTLRTVGIGADHRPYQSARPLGLIIGLDAGVDVTAMSVPQSFRDAMTQLGNTEKIPVLIPVPRFNLRKGLPFSFDVGTSFVAFKDARLFGGDLQWAFLKAGVANGALRFGYNSTKLWYIKTTTYSMDAVGSLHLLLVDPYMGLGWQWGSGELDIPVTSLPTTVSLKNDFSNARMFFGLPFNLTLLRVTAEYGYSFANIHTYGVKVALSF